MSTLIVYASKYGGTAKIAEILSEEIKSDVDLRELKTPKNINFDDYDNILIGTPIYAGRARKAIRKFCKNNLEALLTKNVGIFINCWFHDKLEEYIQNSFPAELVEEAKIVYAGIESDPSEMSWLDRLVVKTVAKRQESVSDIKYENLQKLARDSTAQ